MKGILFTPTMITAIQERRKTQTRRIIKELTETDKWNVIKFNARFHAIYSSGITATPLEIKPRYRTEETVYIKEVHRFSFAWEGTKTRDIPPSTRVYYKDSEADIPLGRWRSPMFMPEWAARDYIKITDVKPERLKDITEGDAIAESCHTGITLPSGHYTAVFDFMTLWDSINGKTYPYDLNPWVWRICFNLIEDKR